MVKHEVEQLCAQKNGKNQEVAGAQSYMKVVEIR